MGGAERSLIPGQAGELRARDELCGGAVLLHMGVLQHVLEVVERDVLGHARSRKHGAVAVKFDARQDRRGLAAACARQLCYDLNRQPAIFSGTVASIYMQARLCGEAARQPW